MMSGTPIVAGMHHPARWFSPRSSNEDLWADLSIAATATGASSLDWSSTPSAADLARFSSYLTQARSFYLAAVAIDLRSRPLPAYYALLNLAKAWLTLLDPASTAGKLRHGSADARPQTAGPYTVASEEFLVQAAGVLSEVAKRTGAGFSFAADTKLQLSAVMPTLCEAFDYAPASTAASASLVPLRNLSVRQADVPKTSGTGTTGALWLRAEVDRGTAIVPNALVAAAPQFASIFGHVRGVAGDPYRFESDAHRYGHNTNLKLPQTLADISKALIFIDRTSTRRRYFVLRATPSELSQEARTFAVMLHLSNMVRYRPEHVESLAASPDSWLLSTWVPRALENSLLTYSARIMKREAFIE